MSGHKGLYGTAVIDPGDPIKGPLEVLLGNYAARSASLVPLTAESLPAMTLGDWGIVPGEFVPACTIQNEWKSGVQPGWIDLASI